jgi:hypothetical protein
MMKNHSGPRPAKANICAVFFKPDMPPGCTLVCKKALGLFIHASRVIILKPYTLPLDIIDLRHMGDIDKEG